MKVLVVSILLVLCLGFSGLSVAWADPVLIFTGEATETRDLYQIDLERMTIQPWLKTSDNEEMAAVSPDGSRVAFVSDRQGAMSLYLLPVTSANATGTDISAGPGAYSFPAWSMDGKQITVSYAPDPEARLFNRRLVLLDPETRQQKTLIDSATWPKSEGTEMVLDRPLWLDEKTLIFVAIEYADPADAPRIVSSTLYRLVLPDGKPERLVGGESYFDASGSSRGFSATFPTRHGSGIAFVAREGRFKHTPMITSADGRKKQVVPLRDPAFFGPVIEVGKGFVYGIQDEEGGLKLMYLPAAKQKAVPIPFAGEAYEPVLMP